MHTYNPRHVRICNQRRLYTYNHEQIHAYNHWNMYTYSHRQMYAYTHKKAPTYDHPKHVRICNQRKLYTYNHKRLHTYNHWDMVPTAIDKCVLTLIGNAYLQSYERSISFKKVRYTKPYKWVECRQTLSMIGYDRSVNKSRFNQTVWTELWSFQAK